MINQESSKYFGGMVYLSTFDISLLQVLALITLICCLVKSKENLVNITALCVQIKINCVSYDIIREAKIFNVFL